MASNFLKQLGVCPTCGTELGVLNLETNEDTCFNILHTQCKNSECGLKWDFSFKVEEV